MSVPNMNSVLFKGPRKTEESLFGVLGQAMAKQENGKLHPHISDDLKELSAEIMSYEARGLTSTMK